MCIRLLYTRSGWLSLSVGDCVSPLSVLLLLLLLLLFLFRKREESSFFFMFLIHLVSSYLTQSTHTHTNTKTLLLFWPTFFEFWFFVHLFFVYLRCVFGRRTLRTPSPEWTDSGLALGPSAPTGLPVNHRLPRMVSLLKFWISVFFYLLVFIRFIILFLLSWQLKYERVSLVLLFDYFLCVV